MFELEEVGGGMPHACIKVVGVGGAGGNVINNMIASNIRSVEFIAINTDAQVLETSMASRRIQIGRAITRGLGAGSVPEVGRDSALEDKESIQQAIEGADMVFITAGMGGGTGTGAAPVVAEVARSMGAVTVAIVTKPFFYEGGVRKRNADAGIRELQGRVDTMIVIPNDRIAMVVDKNTPLLESFAIANDVLRHAVQGISDLVLIPGLINLDFADVKTVISSAGRAVIGMGVGRGEGGAHDAAMKAIMNPLLENNSIQGASGVLINITGGLSMTLNDVQQATASIHESAKEDSNIMMGAVIDPDLKDEIRVTVIATRFEDPLVIPEAAQASRASHASHTSHTREMPAPSMQRKPAAQPATAPVYAVMASGTQQPARVAAEPRAPERRTPETRIPEPVMKDNGIPQRPAQPQHARPEPRHEETPAFPGLPVMPHSQPQAAPTAPLVTILEDIYCAEMIRGEEADVEVAEFAHAEEDARQFAGAEAVSADAGRQPMQSAVRPGIMDEIMRKREDKQPKKKRQSAYRGADRVLSKALPGMGLLGSGDPLDIPTFLRRPASLRQDH